MNKLTAKEKFDKVLSGKGMSTKGGLCVESIQFDLFCLAEKNNWEEYLELLQVEIDDDRSMRRSEYCFLMLYWLFYEEQLDKQKEQTNISKDKVFLDDIDISAITLSKGKEILLQIKEGNSEYDTLDYLRHIIIAIDDLNIKGKDVLDFLLETDAYVNQSEISNNKIITLLKKSLKSAIESQTRTDKKLDAK